MNNTSEDLISKLKINKNITLPVALGINQEGQLEIKDLVELDNILIGGSTGSGKSTFINSVINGLRQTISSEKLKLLLIDPKKVEFHQFANSPYLLTDIFRDPQDAMSILEKLTDKAKNNNQYTLVVIDTFSDLFFEDPEKFQDIILKLVSSSQESRIHFIMSDSRVSSELYTDKLIEGFKTRIAFHTSSAQQSELLIGESGGEALNGAGELIVKIGVDIEQLQGAVIE